MDFDRESVGAESEEVERQIVEWDEWLAVIAGLLAGVVNVTGAGHGIAEDLRSVEIDDDPVIPLHVHCSREACQVGDLEGGAEIGGDELVGRVRPVADDGRFISLAVAELSAGRGLPPVIGNPGFARPSPGRCRCPGNSRLCRPGRR